VHITASITTLAAPPPTAARRIVCFRQGGSSNSARGTQPSANIEFKHDLGHLQQIQQLEKRLFAKSDGWRGTVVRPHFRRQHQQQWFPLTAAPMVVVLHAGGLFEEQLRKRNTYLLYVLQEDGQSCAAQVGL
jgi:hypothetical protein